MIAILLIVMIAILSIVIIATGIAVSDRYMANLRTNIVDFRGFDSSIILILRGGILRPIGNLPESLSQAILVGIMLVGGLGVYEQFPDHPDPET